SRIITDSELRISQSIYYSITAGTLNMVYKGTKNPSSLSRLVRESTESRRTAKAKRKTSKTSRMKASIFTVLCTIAFLSRCTLRSEALPMANAEELDFEPETLGEGLAEATLSSGPVGSRIIVVADSNLLRSLKALDRSIPQLGLAERILNPERRDISQDFSPSSSIIRRDTMRCMVGRVYRPCWEV
ncbi:hypothetical protein NFI96_000902, partial [Prochilodus magdalenae]